MCEKQVKQNSEKDTILGEGETKYHRRINQTFDGYALHEIIFDDQGKPIDYRFLEVNSAFEKLTGLKAESVVGHTVLEILPRTEPIWIENLGKVVSTGESIYFEHFSRHFNRHFEVMAFRTAPNQVACFFTDITDRNKANEASERRATALIRPLDSSEEISFEDLFNLEDIQRLQDEFAEATGVASIITHPDGTPITAPSKFCRLCSEIIRKTKIGCENCQLSDALIGKGCIDGPKIQVCLSGGLWDSGAGIKVGGRHIANWLIGQVRDESQSEGKMREYARKIGADEEDVVEAFREVPAMSHERFEKVSRVLFTLANQLSMTAYQNVQQARFIAERKQAGEVLLAEKQFSESLINSMPGLFYIVSEKGKFLRWNTKFESVSGRSAEEISQITPLDLFEGEDKQTIDLAIKRVFADGYAQVEGQLLTKEGKRIPYQFSGAKIMVEGQPCLIGLGLDVTERKKAEQVMLAEKNFSESLINSLPGLFYIMNEQGNFLRWNTKLEEVTGCSAEEIARIKSVDLVEEKDKQAIASGLQKVFTNGHAEDEAVIVAKDGKRTPYQFSGEKILVDGKPCLIGIGFDITDRKQAEEVLLAEKHFSESLINSMPGAFYLVSEEGKFLRWNTKLEEVTGRSAEEIACVNPIELFENEDKDTIASGAQRIFSIGHAVDEARYISKDGKKTYYQFTGKKILVDGKPCLIGLGFDITDRKQAELALATEKDLLAVTLRSIGDGVITTDTDGNIVMLNKAAEVLTGWHSNEAVGRSLPEVFHIVNERTRQKCDDPVERVLAKDGIVELENHTSLISKDGREIIIADSGAPIYDSESRIVGVVLVFRDMTEKQKLEDVMQKSQKLESLGVLAGGIAHDFNNLLGGIFGYIELAIGETTEDNVSACLREALGNIDRARALTQQLLTFAKGGTPIKKVEYLFPFVQKTTQFALSGSAVSSKFDIQENLWPCEFDKNQIGQVIDNLVINAQQAMPNGGVIEVTARNVSFSAKEHVSLAAGNYVVISIKDQGIGIPKEFLTHIFDPYYTTKTTGHGLGLATCYSIIARHDGCIDVESKPGAGSTFRVYLPAFTESISMIGKSEGEHRGSGTFLVMDDDEAMRFLMKKSLESFGYTVVLKKNGQDAIDFFMAENKAGRKLAGMIFDLTIPGGMGGKEAIREIRKISSDTPAFVASGYAEDPIMAYPEKYGFNASICKPCMKAELSEMLEKHLKKFRSRE